jgi:hypothetical protein
MATLSQKQIFGWEDVEILGDLERLALLLGNIPDNSLMEALEEERGKGRNEYPIRPVWNSILAGIVYQHQGIESLRRELLRNGQLRAACGFDILAGTAAVPPSWVYTRFLSKLITHKELIDGMFETMVRTIAELVPDFGRVLAIDGKQLNSYGKAVADEKTRERGDGRRENDADWGTKTHAGTDESGKTWEKVTHWFGFKLHLIVDAKYELPVMYTIKKASEGEQPVGLAMIKDIGKRFPEISGRAEYLNGDRGYDDTKIIVESWDSLGIKPIIDIRNCWKDGDKTRVVDGLANVVYDYKGTVSCVCIKTGEEHEMAYGGFESDRQCHKYLCPADQLGIACKGKSKCPISHQVRIPLACDRRVFTPVARSTYKWKRMYKSRTAVERVNSRIDRVFGFEQHFIRGRKKMELRVGIALIVMLAMACGRIRQNKPELLRNILKSAA